MFLSQKISLSFLELMTGFFFSSNFDIDVMYDALYVLGVGGCVSDVLY